MSPNNYYVVRYNATHEKKSIPFAMEKNSPSRKVSENLESTVIEARHIYECFTACIDMCLEHGITKPGFYLVVFSQRRLVGGVHVTKRAVKVHHLFLHFQRLFEPRRVLLVYFIQISNSARTDNITR